jgi:hypothetical protein
MRPAGAPRRLKEDDMRTTVWATVIGFTVLAAVPAAARQELRNVASLHAGVALPDIADFSENYRNGLDLSLDYATRMNRNNERWFVAGSLGNNRFTGKNDGRFILWNLNANARWYFDKPGERFTAYLGAGPGVYWVAGGDSWFGLNAGVGADYPVGSDWSVELDVDQHYLPDATNAAFVTVKLGLAYWFW